MMVEVVDMPIDVRRIGKIDVAVLEKEHALALILAAVAMKQPYMICFANAHTVNLARKKGGFALALQSALVLNDGIGVDLASRWLYRRPFPANLAGTDFIPELLDRLGGGTKLFLLGSPPGVAEKAASAIIAQHNHIKVVGTQHGFFAEEDEDSLLKRIGASAADVVLVAMGHPRQEIWAARTVDRLGVTVICVGAMLDFYAGKVPRAPVWMRRLRSEWAFRLLLEPRRLASRYILGNFTFLANILTADRREGQIAALPQIRSIGTD